MERVRVEARSLSIASSTNLAIGQPNHFVSNQGSRGLRVCLTLSQLSASRRGAIRSIARQTDLRIGLVIVVDF